MPQFDTFCFFSQLFWVFVGFSYLYLLLCFYILPAFAAVLKTRSKKLAQTTTSYSSLETTSLNVSSYAYIQFFAEFCKELIVWFSGPLFLPSGFSTNINSLYSHKVLKNEVFYKFNLLLLSELEIVSFFLTKRKVTSRSS